jgi:hypothetical protein
MGGLLRNRRDDMRIWRRKRTRREALRRHADDLIGQLSWSATRWYGRQLRSEIPDGVVRWSAIAGGAGIMAALAKRRPQGASSSIGSEEPT